METKPYVTEHKRITSHYSYADYVTITSLTYLFADYHRNMTSQISTLVPVLNGPNYQEWAPMMKAFLQGQGQWRNMQKPWPALQYPPKTVTKTNSDGDPVTVEEPDTSQDPVNREEVDDWKELNDKAIGNITLRLHHAVRFKHRSYIEASQLWAALEKEFGTPGIGATYHEFKSALNISFPENSDPSLAITKLLGHFG